jgi:hypothetical protein
MYALSRRNDTNAQYWVKRNQGIVYFGIISSHVSTKSVQQIKSLLMIYNKNNSKFIRIKSEVYQIKRPNFGFICLRLSDI